MGRAEQASRAAFQDQDQGERGEWKRSEEEIIVGRAEADSQLITLPEAKADAPEGSVPVLDLSHLGKFKLVSLSVSGVSSSPIPCRSSSCFLCCKPGRHLDM